MPRNHCCLCNEMIEKMDFYIQSRRGKICSECMVTQKALREDMQVLLNRERYERDEHIVRDGVLARMAVQNYW